MDICNEFSLMKNQKKVYIRVTAVSEKLHFAEWIDEKGEEKWGRKYLNELKDARNIKSCTTFQSFAKAYIRIRHLKKTKTHRT